MKKSNESQLDWVKLNLLKLDVSVVSIAAWNAQELFSMDAACRSKYSTESQKDFVEYFCNVLADHIKLTEHEINYSDKFEIFRKMFNIN
jgi:hypothetical protein